jgi:hypothetical protein
VQTSSSDGRVTNADARIIGSLHACLGATGDSTRSNFYGVGTVAGVSFVGKGECVLGTRDFPEAGIMVARCFLELTELPEGYVGGYLTTNTVLSRVALGGVSDPPGYTQPSIATIRLWKRRK